MPVLRQNLDQTSFFRKMLAYEATWTQRLHSTRLGLSRFRVLTITNLDGASAIDLQRVKATDGLFAWLGLFLGLEVNSLFAVALLTIAGYSVNDTVVVFDRIREKRSQLKDLPLADQADAAVSATLTRSLYTSFTTLLPLLALILFGGSTLVWFAVALSVGILVGAWSSIAVAPTLLPVLSRR